jgi:hypothetical protein
MDGSGCGLIKGSLEICLEGLRNTTKKSVSIAGLLTKI